MGPRRRERTSLVKNRMREICTSGSVRGEGGNILTYSAVLALERCETCGEGLAAMQVLDLAKEREPACRVGVGERRQEQPPEQSTCTGRRKPGLQRTQRVSSSDIPPPGTIIWTCG